MPPVLHRGAKAITAPEFFDALQATCLPRYPGARGTEPRRVGEFPYFGWMSRRLITDMA